MKIKLERKYVERLWETANILFTKATDESFDLEWYYVSEEGDYISMPDERLFPSNIGVGDSLLEGSCGTAGCATGWACVVHPQWFKNGDPGDQEAYFPASAAEGHSVQDIDVVAWQWLFGAPTLDTTHVGPFGPMSERDVSRTGTAKRIMDFVRDHVEVIES